MRAHRKARVLAVKRALRELAIPSARGAMVLAWQGSGTLSRAEFADLRRPQSFAPEARLKSKSYNHFRPVLVLAPITFAVHLWRPPGRFARSL